MRWARRPECWTPVLVVVACGVLTGCRGEKKCGVGVAKADDRRVESCELEEATPYNLVLEAEGIEDRPDEESDGPGADEELFDDWDARVKVRIVEPDGDERSYEGGTGSTMSVHQQEGLSGETVSIQIDRYIPGESGEHELVVEESELGPQAPADALEVTIRKD